MATLLTNLVGYYKFDESNKGTLWEDSTRIQDASGKSTISVSTDGKINNCVEYTSNTSSVYLLHNTTQSAAGLTEYSFSMWFYLDTSASALGRYVWLFKTTDSEWLKHPVQAYIGYSGGIADQACLSIMTDTSVNRYVFTGTTLVSEKTWHHLVCTMKAGELLGLYLDNVKFTNHTFTGSSLWGYQDGRIFIGNADTTSGYAIDGKIDEVGIWTRELTATEVDALYNNGEGLTYPFTEDTSVSGTAYYVSNSGSDNYSGLSKYTPWQTLTKVNASLGNLSPGDGILFRRGDTFVGTLGITGKSGTNGNPIIFGAYGSGEKPKISGFTTVPSWTSLGNGIYYSSAIACETSTNMVIVDGSQYAMGRWPNTGWNTIDAATTTSLRDASLTSAYNWTGAQVVIRKNHWVIDRLTILTHNVSTLTFASSAYNPAVGFGYFIQADLSTLDNFGDWYYDVATQRLYMYFGAEDPSNHDVKISTLDKCVSSNSNYHTFDNLNIEGSNEAAMYYYISGSSYNYGISVKDCCIYFSGEDGIWAVNPIGWTVENCDINFTNTNAVYLPNGSDNLVTNNLIQNTFTFSGLGQNGDGHGNAVILKGRNNTIQYNRIINTGYLSTDLGGANLLVQYNYIDNFCSLKDDGGGIYIYNDLQPGKRVLNNIVGNARGAAEGTTSTTGGANGLYSDGGAGYIEWRGNTVFDIPDGMGFHNNDVNHEIISENTIYNCGGFFDINDNNDADYSVVEDVSIIGNIFFCPYVERGYYGKRAISIYRLVPSPCTFTFEEWYPSIGVIDDNYYYTQEPCFVSFVSNINSTLRANYTYNYDRYITNYGQDSHSKLQLPYAEYTCNGSLGPNKVTNSTFDTGITGYVDTPGTYTSIAWYKSPVFDSSCLRITSSVSDGYYNIYEMVYHILGSVSEGKNYILKFDAYTDIPYKTLQPQIVQHHDPWVSLVVGDNFYIRDVSTTVEYLWDTLPDDSNVRLNLRVLDGTCNIYIDNVQFYEASINALNPSDNFLFFYNASIGVNKTITLPAGRFIDVSGNSYLGTVDLSPFTSIILMHDLIEENPLLIGLLDYYDFNETEGSTFISKTGYNNITLAKDVSVGMTGKIDKCVGSNSVGTRPGLSANSSIGWDTITDEFTLSAWVRFIKTPSEHGDTMRLFKFDSIDGIKNSYIDIFALNTDSRIYFYASDVSITLSNYTYSSPQFSTRHDWFHMVCIANGIGNPLKIYINNQDDSQRTDTLQDVIGPTLGSHNFLCSTYDVATYSAEAMIDEVGIWNRALTVAEVSTLYNNGSGISYPFNIIPEGRIYLTANGYYLIANGKLLVI